MKITKEEEKIITINRLMEKVSKKFEENYFSLEIRSDGVNCYFPTVSHNRFDNTSNAIDYLRKLLSKTLYEYKYDITKLDNLILETESKLRENKNKLKDAKKLRKEYIDKLGVTNASNKQ
jgi:hypothetical protein